MDADGNETLFSYGAFAQLRAERDPLGNITRTHTDPYGFRDLLEDPDLGTRRATVNAFGEAATESDASQTLSFDYDVLGRLHTRTDQRGAASTWNYDTATNGIGQLAETISTDGHRRRFTYDSFGRVETHTAQIGVDNYTQRYYRDALGRVERLVYPAPTGASSPFTVRYDYQNGAVLRVSNANASGTIFWERVSTDQTGRTTRERLGNNVGTTRTYRFDGRIRSINSTLSTRTIQSLTYGYDGESNLISRADALRNTTEGFWYDRLSRLTGTRILSGAITVPTTEQLNAPGGTPSLYGVIAAAGGYEPTTPNADNLAIRYDVLGNIRSKSDVGSYARGNLSQKPGLTFTHNSLDQIRTVTHSRGITSFEYDADGSVFREWTPDEQIDFFDGVFERHTFASRTTHRFIIRVDGAPVAQIEREISIRPPPDVTLYLHTDQLGSIDVVTDTSGTEVERRSYDAFGKARTVPGSPAARRTTFGYTGHVDEPALGFVNMRGRPYDPSLGRFLTPDPLAGGAHETQARNRYSYALNGPLSYVDPTGWGEEEPTINPGTYDFSNEPSVIIAWMGARPPSSPIEPPAHNQGTELVNGPARDEESKSPLGKYSTAIHLGLTALSFVPGLNVAASIVDAGLYLVEGDKTGALIAATGIVLGGAVVAVKAASGAVKAGKAAKAAKGALDAEQALAGTSKEVLELADALQKTVNRQGAVTDRFLRSSKSLVAKTYRATSATSPNFAKMIRGRVLDRQMGRVFQATYSKVPGARINQTLAGHGSLRPDLYLPNVGGRSVIFDVGGPSKITGILKYTGMADDLIPLVPTQWLPF